MWQTTWKTMMRLFANFDIKKDVDFTHNQQRHEVKFLETGSEIILFDARFEPSDPDITRLGSMEVTKAFIDQSEQVDARVVEKIGERVGTHQNLKYNLKGKVLESFNPAHTHVYRRYYKPWKASTTPTRPSWSNMTPCWTCPPTPMSSLTWKTDISLPI